MMEGKAKQDSLSAEEDEKKRVDRTFSFCVRLLFVVLFLSVDLSLFSSLLLPFLRTILPLDDFFSWTTAFQEDASSQSDLRQPIKKQILEERRYFLLSSRSFSRSPWISETNSHQCHKFPDLHLLVREDRVKMNLEDKATSLTIKHDNSVMTNGKELSFSIDSLLSGSSARIPLPTSSSSHSVSKLLTSSSSSAELHTDSNGNYSKFASSFSRFCPELRGDVGGRSPSPPQATSPYLPTPMTSSLERIRSYMHVSPSSSSSCLQSSAFYPWLLAQRQAVSVAAFHHPFTGKSFYSYRHLLLYLTSQLTFLATGFYWFAVCPAFFVIKRHKECQSEAGEKSTPRNKCLYSAGKYYMTTITSLKVILWRRKRWKSVILCFTCRSCVSLFICVLISRLKTLFKALPYFTLNQP